MTCQANPNNWGLPVARFDFGADCPSQHFTNQSMVFDLTFCGGWAGSVFKEDCPGKGDCDTFVQYNPSQFTEAYWLINFVKVMKSA